MYFDYPHCCCCYCCCRFGQYLGEAVPLVVSYGHKAAEGDDELREFVLQVRLCVCVWGGGGCVQKGERCVCVWGGGGGA